MSVIDRIAAFVSDHAGFETSGAGRQQLITAIERRHGVGNSLEEYFEKLVSSPLELRSLLEDFVVPETFFFRYEESFRAHPVGWGEEEAAASHLSAACSTGEESYSIAFPLSRPGGGRGIFKSRPLT